MSYPCEGKVISKIKPPVWQLCQGFSERDLVLGLFGPCVDWTTTQGQARSNRGKCLVTWLPSEVTFFFFFFFTTMVVQLMVTELYRSIWSELLLGGMFDLGLHQVVFNHIYNLRIELSLSCCTFYPNLCHYQCSGKKDDLSITWINSMHQLYYMFRISPVIVR